MLATDVIRIVPIKFRSAGRLYDFEAGDLDLAAGDRVVLETDRGRALGTVVQSPREIPRSEAPEGLKGILRIATEEDISLSLSHAAREKEAFRFCRQRINDRKMEMKMVRAEFLFDGSKIIFYFTADGRIDFRELVKDLAHHFHTRIEMRQIGVRDEAKLIGGTGICGRELCCCTFLTDFAPVSVKMAKEQGLALNPNKISGQCGRLLCCLAYEYETYCSLKKGLPKCGRKVHFNGMDGEVIDQNVLTQKIKVRLQDGKTMEIPAEQVDLEGGGAPCACSGAPILGQKSPLPSKPDGVEGGARPARTASARGSKPSQPRQDRSKPPQPRQDKQETPENDNAAPSSPDQPAEKTGRRKNRNRRRPRPN